METSWRLWCRMCARKPSSYEDDKFPNLSDNGSEFAELVHRHFPNSISKPLATNPNKICLDCMDFLYKIKAYDEICLRSEKIFKEIIAAENQDSGLVSIRSSHFSDDDDYVPLGRITRNKVPLKRGRKPKVSPDAKRFSTRKRKMVHEDIKEDLDTIEKQEMEVENEVLNSIESNLSSKNKTQEDDEENKIKTVLEKTTKQKKSIKTKCPEDPKAQNLTRCPECPKVFKSKKLMKMHYNVIHTRNSSIRHECKDCSKTFLNESYLHVHKLTHLPPDQRTRFPCPHCEKLFVSSSGLATHIQNLHFGEKPYVCEECGKAFVSTGGLKEHKYTHTDDRPFQCPQCPKRFKNQPALKLHSDIHVGTEYICPICGKRLNTRKTLNRHMVVHSDVKKYKCHLCGNEFKRAKSLKSHLILHSGLHPYSCPFCDRTFVNGSNCRTHKLKMHPEEFAAQQAAGQEDIQVTLPKLHQLQSTPIQK